MATTDIHPTIESETLAYRAAAAETPATETTPTASVAARGAIITIEQVAYVAIGLVALVAHLWGLGDRALHHDETLHAVYSWYIYTGQGYTHDPLLHGPFLYYFGALLYFLFGDNDVTARLGVALFGTVLTVLPYLVRHQIGRTAALTASVYLLISPAFLYVGRFFRHDMYSIVFELLIFVAIVRYATSRQAGWLFLGAAAFGLMYTNQETSYLFLLILGTPLVLLMLWHVFKPGVALLGALGMALAVLVFVLPGTAVVDGGHKAIRDPNTNEMVIAAPGPLLGWGPLETEDNEYALQIRNRPDNLNGNSFFANLVQYLGGVGIFLRHPAILTSMILFVGISGLLIWLIWFERGADGLSRWQRAIERGDRVLPVYASLAWGNRGLLALGVFFVIYALLFTAFFTNLIGVISGTTGSLLYWLAQHNVERGGQPGYYYLVILAIYEPLALLGGGVGLLLVAMSSVRLLLQRLQATTSNTRAGDPPDAPDTPGEASQPVPHTEPATPSPGPFAGPGPLGLVVLLLAWWTLGALGIYSWAGEKMPWLTVHVALPLVLLGAWAFQQVLAWGFRTATLDRVRGPLLTFVGLFGLVVGMGFVQMTATIGQRAATDSAPLVGFAELMTGTIGQGITPYSILLVMIVGLTLALLCALLLASSLTWGLRLTVGGLAVAIVLMGGLYSVRNAYRVNYRLGDVPREMLIYTQTSPDVAYVVRQLEDASRLRTAGLDMPILYDNETVWLWYLRDFTNATNTGPRLAGPPDADVQAVLMLQENIDRHPETRDYLADFRIQRLPLRWWFPESAMYYKGDDWQTVDVENASLLTRVMRAPFSEATIVGLWDFLIHRDPGVPLGSTDFVIAVRPELADQIAPGIGSSQAR